MTLVATDGHRLALVNVKHDGQKGDDIKAILPRKTLSELSRLLAEGDTDVKYERGENHLFFEIGPRLLISRMIDGQFPAYDRVIPKGNDKNVEFERDKLTQAVRRVAILSNERSRAVKMILEKGKVEVTSSSPEFGEAHEPIPTDYNGPSLTICFNAQYVLDFLNVVESEVVALELKDEVSQAVMKPVAADGYDYTYVRLWQNSNSTVRATAATATITAPTASRSSKASKRSASVRQCTSARLGRPDCIISSTKSSTTRSMKRWPASVPKSTSRFISTTRSASSTTAAAFPPTCTKAASPPLKLR
jgi:hypothetical protein